MNSRWSQGLAQLCCAPIRLEAGPLQVTPTTAPDRALKDRLVKAGGIVINGDPRAHPGPSVDLAM